MEQVYPEPTVGGLILNGRGDVLLVRSMKWFDRLTIPGGHIELGETMEEALRREVKEEVGLDVDVVEFLLTQEAIFSSEFWKKRHFIFFDYLCTARGERVVVDGKEIQGYLWATPRAALGMNVDSFMRRVLEEYLRRHDG